MKSETIFLVHCARNSPTRDWEAIAATHRVIVVDNYAVMSQALQAGTNELGKEIGLVLFDKSTSSRRFLDFLADLPLLYRGDVLFVQPEGSAYLSSVMPREGRVLYRLEAQDVDFYLSVHFDARGALPREEGKRQFALVANG